MKIKFDENISPKIVEALRVLEKSSDIELGSVLIDYGGGHADPDWMYRFRDEGGAAMVSGDHNILQNKVNLLAYTESGLVSIWPDAGWPKLKLWGQAALIVRWWTAIRAKIGASEPGDRWRIPMQWTPSADAFKAIKDPRID